MAEMAHLAGVEILRGLYEKIAPARTKGIPHPTLSTLNIRVMGSLATADVRIIGIMGSR